jgi:hypothetical protein
MQVPVPRMVFHFQGADLDPRRNYVHDNRIGGDACAFYSPTSAMRAPRSATWNMVQQDMRVLYDLEAETLSFAPAQC